MYINDENALRIDYARNTVESWYKQKLLKLLKQGAVMRTAPCL